MPVGVPASVHRRKSRDPSQRAKEKEDQLCWLVRRGPRGAVRQLVFIRRWPSHSIRRGRTPAAGSRHRRRPAVFRSVEGRRPRRNLLETVHNRAVGVRARMQKEQVVRRLQRLADLGFLAVLLLAPWFMGGRHPQGRLVLAAIVSVTGVAWGGSQWLGRRPRWSWSGAELILLLAIGLVVLQLLPLPYWVLARLSPSLPEMLPLWSDRGPSEALWGTWHCTLADTCRDTRRPLHAAGLWRALPGHLPEAAAACGHRMALALGGGGGDRDGDRGFAAILGWQRQVSLDLCASFARHAGRGQGSVCQPESPCAVLSAGAGAVDLVVAARAGPLLPWA